MAEPDDDAELTGAVEQAARAEPGEILVEQLVPVLARHHREMARELGLRDVELTCLELAERRGGVAMGLLAERIGRSAATTTGIVDGLERAGHAVRWHHPLDERRVMVSAERPSSTSRPRADLDAELARIAEGFGTAELETVARWLFLVAQTVHRRSDALVDARPRRCHRDTP